jgi:signal peptidase
MLKKIAKYLGLTTAVVLITLAVVTFLAPRFGWRVDVVLSGSMEPRIHTGSVVVSHPSDLGSVNAGDIITFRSPQNGKFTTHRVISVENSPSLFFRTKGDANASPDPFIVGYQSVVGKVCFNVAYLGYVTLFIKSRLGLILVLYLPALILILIEVKNIWRVLAEEKTARTPVVK